MDTAGLLCAGVGEAVGVVCTGTDMHFGCAAHQVVIVDAFGALACSDVGQDLGQAAMGAGVDEGGTGGVVCGAGDGDGGGVACGVVVEGTIGNTAVCNVRCHERFLRVSAARAGRLPVPHSRPVRCNQKDPIVYPNFPVLASLSTVGVANARLEPGIELSKNQVPLCVECA